MRLTGLHPKQTRFTFSCSSCARRVTERGIADLDCKPFTGYLCERCAEELYEMARSEEHDVI